MQAHIYLQEVLETMKLKDSKGFAVPFSISFRTLQKNSKTGGRLIHYPKAKLVMPEGLGTNKNSVNSLRTAPKKKTARKNPNHFENKTRNIEVIPSNNKKRKIHIRYIVSFNGKKVLY